MDDSCMVQDFSGGSNYRCGRNTKRARVRAWWYDWTATISWENHKGWGGALYYLCKESGLGEGTVKIVEMTAKDLKY